MKPKPPSFITMTPCKSSNIARLGYDAASKTLAVQFRSGTRWHYHDVPEKTYRAISNADSVGGYFAAHIRDTFAGNAIPDPKRRKAR